MLRGMQIVGLLVCLIIIISVFQPSKQEEPKPWDITLMPDGNSRVFNLHLGHSRLVDAQHIFKDLAETAIFAEPDHLGTAEAFFSSVNLAGLSAKVILSLDVSADLLTTMKANSPKQSHQESGSIKYEIANQDAHVMTDSIIKTLEYIPAVTIDESAVEHRFGKPEEIKRLDDSGSQLWLYPSINFKVFITKGSKTIFHYHSR